MNWWRKLTTFVGEVRGELRKTTWPGWTEVRGTTIVVVVTSMIFSVFLWVVDIIIARVVNTITTLFTA